jgi:hypothetical protein
MMVQKGEPLVLGVTAAHLRHRYLATVRSAEKNAKLLQFRMNLGSAPVGILLGQTSDPIPPLLGDPRPPAARTRPPAPVKAKAGAVPCADGFWFDMSRTSARPGQRQRRVVQNNRTPPFQGGRGLFV